MTKRSARRLAAQNRHLLKHLRRMRRLEQMDGLATVLLRETERLGAQCARSLDTAIAKDRWRAQQNRHHLTQPMPTSGLFHDG